MSSINQFLLSNGFSIATNPCVSPDFCLNWPGLLARIQSGNTVKGNPLSRFSTAAGTWELLAADNGDRAWRLTANLGIKAAKVLDSGELLSPGVAVFPATFANLLRLKNLIQEFDSESTIFPRADARLSAHTLGIGARFTTLHWPAVEWAMAALNMGVTANQNSIPRELVYDVDAMLGGRLDSVPFPFIGCDVPEGHQGQSVEGMSHGAVLSKLETGFHLRRLPWNFNADHQPIGGKFDAREPELVAGSVLANYITFDLSPELALNQPAKFTDIDPALVATVQKRVAPLGFSASGPAFEQLLCKVWPAVKKMKRRDDLYRECRQKHFTTEAGRAIIRELSIDELPGLTAPETTAAMLALCEALGMKIHFIAPAFGFQKNCPYPDNAGLRRLVQPHWEVCQQFGTSIGFHSGSGKSAENYRVVGEITGSHLEIKTSGRYTYEMGVALSRSTNPTDQALWKDWYAFTQELALAGAFSADATEQKMARLFIVASLPAPVDTAAVFANPAACRAAVERLSASPDHMLFFEYNFLFVLAAGGLAKKSALGDHTPAGYRQRARFYAISDEARLRYAQGSAGYIIFLAETTGLAPAATCAAARQRLEGCTSYAEFVAQIAP